MDPQAPFLQERILQVCEGATRGAGAFAFVTSEGVDLLLPHQYVHNERPSAVGQ
jgi:hypothetical protein